MIKAPEYFNVQSINDIYQSVKDIEGDTIELDLSETVNVDACAIQLLLVIKTFCDQNNKKMTITNDQNNCVPPILEGLCIDSQGLLG